MADTLEFPEYPPLFLVRITEKIRGRFLWLYRKFTHPNVAVFEMVQHFWLAAGIGVAAELGLADILKKGDRKVSELASLTQTHEESLYRLMRMLASHAVFRELKDRIFTLTPLAKALQEDQVKYLISGHLTKLHFLMFSDLMESIRTGKSLSDRYADNNLFEHIGRDGQRNELFIRAMTNASLMQAAALLPAYPFRRFKNIFDIGGGQGLMMCSIIKKHTRCQGIVFDLPQSSGLAVQMIDKYGVADRCRFIAGNFFESIPGGGDLYMLKNVLHDWDDVASLKILHNIRKAMPSGSKLLIMESMLDTGNDLSFGKMTDLLMMVAVGGKERTKAEFTVLLSQAGFIIRKIRRTLSPLYLIEAVPSSDL
jgi:hypothetical protein